MDLFGKLLEDDEFMQWQHERGWQEGYAGNSILCTMLFPTMYALIFSPCYSF